MLSVLLMLAASRIVEVPPSRVLGHYEPYAECVLKAFVPTGEKESDASKLSAAKTECSSARTKLMRNVEIYAYIELEVAKLDSATAAYVQHMSAADRKRVVDGRVTMWLNVMDQRLDELASI
jgi:hypothetical protein